MNKGIQISGGGSLNADVVAVGDHAVASKTVHGSAGEIAAAIAELQRAIVAIPLNAQQRELVDREVEEVKNAAASGDHKAAQSFLTRLVEKLKMTGVAVKETAALYEPLVKLATAIGTTVVALGL